MGNVNIERKDRATTGSGATLDLALRSRRLRFRIEHSYRSSLWRKKRFDAVMHRRDPETKSSRAPGSRKSRTQLVKWRANVAHPSKLETSSVYLHPSWKFQNAQPNTAEWLAVSRTTNLALPSRVSSQRRECSREAREKEKKLFTAGVARRKKPSSYRQSWARRDKNRSRVETI